MYGMPCHTSRYLLRMGLPSFLPLSFFDLAGGGGTQDGTNGNKSENKTAVNRTRTRNGKIRLGVAAAGDGFPGHVPGAVAEPVPLPQGLPAPPGLCVGIPLAVVPDHGERDRERYEEVERERSNKRALMCRNNDFCSTLG